jgi:hypothetical protein
VLNPHYAETRKEAAAILGLPSDRSLCDSSMRRIHACRGGTDNDTHSVASQIDALNPAAKSV